MMNKYAITFALVAVFAVVLIRVQADIVDNMERKAGNEMMELMIDNIVKQMRQAMRDIMNGKMPSMPSFPDLPNIPSMPGLPSFNMPSMNMPSINLPSMNMPNIKMPSVPTVNMPSAHGMIRGAIRSI